MYTITCLLLTTQATLADEPPATSTETPLRRNGIETDVAWPLVPGVRAFTVKGTHTLVGAGRNQHGDVIGGIYLRPRVPHDVVQTIDEYLIGVGWRQFLWQGLHAEAINWLGYAWGWNNLIDGRDYANPAWLVELNVGWRLSLPPAKQVGPTIAPQFGIVKGVVTDIGPRENPDFFVTGRLLLGLAF